MSDKPETLADICARIRTIDESMMRDLDFMAVFLEFLPRDIEAAAERERNAHTNDIHDALYKATGIPGNAAALRKALERIRPLVRAAGATQYVPERKALVDGALSIIDGALATPARNCDQFATAEEARAAFEAKRSRGIVRNLYTATFDWLFATAEGGDHA